MNHQLNPPVHNASASLTAIVVDRKSHPRVDVLGVDERINLQ